MCRPLPPEMWREIFTYLPIKDKLVCTTVSKTWKSIIRDDPYLLSGIRMREYSELTGANYRKLQFRRTFQKLRVWRTYGPDISFFKNANEDVRAAMTNITHIIFDDLHTYDTSSGSHLQRLRLQDALLPDRWYPTTITVPPSQLTSTTYVEQYKIAQINGLRISGYPDPRKVNDYIESARALKNLCYLAVERTPSTDQQRKLITSINTQRLTSVALIIGDFSDAMYYNGDPCSTVTKLELHCSTKFENINVMENWFIILSKRYPEVRSLEINMPLDEFPDTKERVMEILRITSSYFKHLNEIAIELGSELDPTREDRLLPAITHTKDCLDDYFADHVKFTMSFHIITGDGNGPSDKYVNVTVMRNPPKTAAYHVWPDSELGTNNFVTSYLCRAHYINSRCMCTPAQ